MRSELALIVLLLAACKKKDDAPPPPRSVQKSAPPPLAEKAFYRLDVGPQTPCHPAVMCQVQLVVTALGDYHVNEKYPTKFVFANDNPAIATADDGSFKLETAKAGVWTMFYRAKQAGKYTLKGTFKLGVCTDEHCEIDSPDIAFDVAVN